MNSEEDLRLRICRAGKTLVREKMVVGNEGNISARIPKTNKVIIKPNKFAMGEVSPEDLIVVDLEGRLIEGTRTPSIETPVHTSIYRHREDVESVLHTHPIYSISLGIMSKPISPLSFTGFRAVFREIPIVPYHHPGSQALAEAVVESLGSDKYAALLKHHGLFAVGKDIESVVELSIGVEKAAKIEFLCLSLGKPSLLPREAIEKFSREPFIE